MRFLGFLTGVLLLMILFVIFGESSIFSANEKRPKKDPHSAAKTVAAKSINLKDPLANSSKQIADIPAKKIRTSKKKPLATDNRKTPKQSETPVLADESETDQPPVISDRVEPDKPKLLINAPTLSYPTSKRDKPNQNDVPRQRLPRFEGGPSNREVRWHHFWGPFNTWNSAQGFANHLAKRIEVEFKVIETKPTEFMVAFPYVSKDNRQSTATLIEQRTGLTIQNK